MDTLPTTQPAKITSAERLEGGVMATEEKTFEKGEKVAFRVPKKNGRKSGYKHVLTGTIQTEPLHRKDTTMLFRDIRTADGHLYNVRVVDIIKMGKPKVTNTWVTPKPFKNESK